MDAGYLAAYARASVTIESVDSDAPDFVEPLSICRCTLTFYNRGGLPVGDVEPTITLVSGQGQFTHDGGHHFTYLAPNSEGTARFHVEVDDLALTIDINVGQPVSLHPSTG